MNVRRFQVYAQAENVHTNNLVLLFSWIHREGNGVLNEFLTNLFGDMNVWAPSVGFELQVNGERSIPDAIISQESFKIIIETKAGAPVNIDQLSRHCSLFENEYNQVLLLIDKEPINENDKTQIERQIAGYNLRHNKDIQFIFKTFDDILRALSDLSEGKSQEVIELYDDFESYCSQFDLLQRAKMYLVPVGQTFDVNVANNLYYCPGNRRRLNPDFIGLYLNYIICRVGKFDKVITVKRINGELFHFADGEWQIFNEHPYAHRINNAAHESNLDMENPWHFYFVNSYSEVNFVRNNGVLRKPWLYDISKHGVLKTDQVNQVIDKINNREWPIR